MTDIVYSLRKAATLPKAAIAVGIMANAAADEIERLRLWIRRIDNINDDPARFSKEIDQACIDALAGKPMIGAINAVCPMGSDKCS